MLNERWQAWHAGLTDARLQAPYFLCETVATWHDMPRQASVTELVIPYQGFVDGMHAGDERHPTFDCHIEQCRLLPLNRMELRRWKDFWLPCSCPRDLVAAQSADPMTLYMCFPAWLGRGGLDHQMTAFLARLQHWANKPSKPASPECPPIVKQEGLKVNIQV